MQFLNSILDFFVSNAYADTTSVAPQAGGGLSLMIMLGLLLVFMYFMTIRPQAKRAKEHRNLLNSLAKGDEVVTVGGILGKIEKINDSYIVLSLADEVKIIVQKNSISSALPKGTLKSIN